MKTQPAVGVPACYPWGEEAGPHIGILEMLTKEPNTAMSGQWYLRWE